MELFPGHLLLVTRIRDHFVAGKFGEFPFYVRRNKKRFLRPVFLGVQLVP